MWTVIDKTRILAVLDVLNPTVVMKLVFRNHPWLVWILIMVCSVHAFASGSPPEPLALHSSLAFPQAVITNTHTIHIPFKLAGRLIAVEARIDTFEGTFILDTGAQRLLLNQSYFRGRSRPNISAAIGNTGMVESVTEKRVDSLHWDNLFFENLEANVLDLSHIERKKNIRLLGIIGFDVFKDFEIFLDFQLRQLILTRLDKDGFRLDPDALWETPYDSLDFKLYRHLIILEGDVDGTPLRFSLDSGAELNLLDRRVKRKVLDSFDIIRRVKMLGAGQNTIEVLAGTLYGIRCGNQQEPEMRTLLTNLTEMNVSFNIRLDGVLGYEFLSSRRTLINYKRKKLFFFQMQRP